MLSNGHCFRLTDGDSAQILPFRGPTGRAFWLKTDGAAEARGCAARHSAATSLGKQHSQTYRGKAICRHNHSNPSLYERLGGIYSIAVVVADFIDRVIADGRLNLKQATFMRRSA
jgi:hypothetical protein